MLKAKSHGQRVGEPEAVRRQTAPFPPALHTASCRAPENASTAAPASAPALRNALPPCLLVIPSRSSANTTADFLPLQPTAPCSVSYGISFCTSVRESCRFLILVKAGSGKLIYGSPWLNILSLSINFGQVLTNV